MLLRGASTFYIALTLARHAFVEDNDFFPEETLKSYLALNANFVRSSVACTLYILYDRKITLPDVLSTHFHVYFH